MGGVAGIWTGWHFQLDQHLQLLLDAFTSGGLKVLNADLGDDLEMELCSSVAECNMVQASASQTAGAPPTAIAPALA